MKKYGNYDVKQKFVVLSDVPKYKFNIGLRIIYVQKEL